MGEFYDAIYTRGANAATLPQQLDDAARELNCCFLVAPEIAGWTAIYPSDGQNENVAMALHKLLKTEVLFTTVHDGDIFQYDYYRDEELVDEYNSWPDYFGKVSPEERQSQAGKPELLLPLLRHPSDLAELERILHSKRGRRVGANLQLAQFGSLLGLPNCATSYRYLMGDDEDEAIERRAEFTHIPDLKPEILARESADLALQAKIGQMRAAGLLLFEQPPSPLTPAAKPTGSGFTGLPLFEQSPSPLTPAADPTGSGFITADSPTTPHTTERPLYRIAPPFEEGPQPLGIVAAPGPQGVLLSPSGRWLATVDHGRIEVWDRQTRSRVAAMEMKPPVNAVQFLPEDRGLVAGGHRLEVFSLPDGRRVRTIEARAGHPAGSLLVVSTGATVQVADLDTGKIVRTFFLDSAQDLTMFEKMQLAAVTAARKAHYDKELQRPAGTKGESPEYQAALAEQARQPLTAESPHAFLFSADGRYLICGTSKSAWAFRWRTLLASGVDTPPAVYRYRSESKSSGKPMSFLAPPDYSQGVGALAYDAETNSALLGCADGVVRRMDLASGEVSTLLTVPGGNWIRSMALSADGSLLSTEDVSMHHLQDMVAAGMGGGNRLVTALKMAVGLAFKDEPRDRMMIWDYRKVRGVFRNPLP